MKKVFKVAVVMGSGALLAFGGLCGSFADSPNGGLPPLEGWGMVFGSIISLFIEAMISGEAMISENDEKMSRMGFVFHTGAYITTAVTLWLWGTVGTYTSYYTVNNFGYYDEFSWKIDGLIPFVILAVLYVARAIGQIIIERKKCV